MFGGGRVEALPNERVDMGIDTGGEEMVRVCALKLCPTLSPH